MMRYLNPGAPVHERVTDLLGRMTLREKVGQLQQRLHGWEAYTLTADGTAEPTSLLREEAERWGGLGSLYGLFRADPWSGVDWSNGIRPERMSAAARVIQDQVLDASRHGIPALLTEEAPHGHQALGAVVLPTNLAVGATWNPVLLRDASAEVALWLRRAGVHLALCSGLDMARDPRWGRSEECYSEDPYLASAMTRASVLGFQGDRAEQIDRRHVGVVLKHLAGQGASIGGRNTSGAPIGTRELAEIHLPAARAGFDAGALGFMASYNDVDGTPSVANHRLLTRMLRDEWGFTGFVMADGGAIDRLAHTGASSAMSAALALNAGVDMSLWDESFTHLEAAVARGLVDESMIDQACARVLATKFRLGLFEDPLPATGELSSGGTGGRLSALSEELAQECLVLLSNDGALPLPDSITRIAVIGPNADDLDALLGDYVAPQQPGGGASLYAALAEAVSAGTEVRTVRGSGLRVRDPAELAAARDLAEWADVTVLAVGGSSRRTYDTAFADNGAAGSANVDPEMTAGEGVDLARIGLDPAQLELAREVRAAGRPVITVVIAGRAHGIEEILNLSDAVIYAWYPGPHGGTAIADVLLGNASPSGALPVSLPRESGTLPIAHDERIEPAGTYADAPAGPLFPFGFSLASQSVSVSTPSLARDELRWLPSASVEVVVDATNGTPHIVDRVVALFAFRPVPGTWPRRRELVGFTKVRLAPHESRSLAFTVDLGWAAPHFERYDEPLEVTFSNHAEGRAVLRLLPPV